MRVCEEPGPAVRSPAVELIGAVSTQSASPAPAEAPWVKSIRRCSVKGFDWLRGTVGGAASVASSVRSVLMEAVEFPESLLTERAWSTAGRAWSTAGRAWFTAGRAWSTAVGGRPLAAAEPSADSFLRTLAYKLPSSGPSVWMTSGDDRKNRRIERG